jgi:GNAT superfamily N-acetyltransferase
VSIILRPAVAGDLPAVGALHQRSRSAAYRDFVPAEALAAVSPEMMGRWWAERWPYERETHLMTVAERDGGLAGFSYVGPHDLDEPSVGELSVGELSAIHLEPEERGRGVGRALMIDALAAMHRRGWRRAALWVLAENAHARDFYRRGGWVPDGVERRGDIGPVPTRQLRYLRDLP